MNRFEAFEEVHRNVKALEWLTNNVISKTEPEKAIYFWITWWIVDDKLLVPMRMSIFFYYYRILFSVRVN